MASAGITTARSKRLDSSPRLRETGGSTSAASDLAAGQIRSCECSPRPDSASTAPRCRVRPIHGPAAASTGQRRQNDPTARRWRLIGGPARAPPSLPILEVPISCTVVAAPGDGQQVVRYLNPAYRPEIFRKSAEAWLGRHSQLVTITHPYEICDGPGHGLLAFDVAAFEQNVAAIERLSGGCEFVTLADLPLQQPLEVASA